MALKPLPRLIAIAAAIGAAWVGVDRSMHRPHALAASVVPAPADVPVADTATVPAQPSLVMSTLAPATGDYVARTLVLPWNAVAGLAYANGGAATARDSLMAHHGVHLALERQDDYGQMVAEQALFAGEVANGVTYPAKGAAFVVIMGDALPGYAASAKAALARLGQQVEVVGALGYSRGEDKCMLPAEVAADPQKARGSLIGAVLR